MSCSKASEAFSLFFFFFPSLFVFFKMLTVSSTSTFNRNLIDPSHLFLGYFSYKLISNITDF